MIKVGNLKIYTRSLTETGCESLVIEIGDDQNNHGVTMVTQDKMEDIFFIAIRNLEDRLEKQKDF